VLNDHALQQRYAFVGPVRVRFERSEELDTGVFRVRSRTVRPEHGGDGPDAGHQYPYQGGYVQAGQQAPSWAPSDPYAAAGYPAAAQVPPGHPASAAPYAPPYSAQSHAAEHQAAEYPPAAPAPYASPYAYPAPVDRPAPTLELDGRRIPLTRAVTVLGRAADVDVPLDDAGVSRRHAEVHVTDGRYRVVDLGSTNGTFVDGERVTTGELRDGSTITVGRSRLVFRLGQR
jgi:predicted component of type VI protein secretion system